MSTQTNAQRLLSLLPIIQAAAEGKEIQTSYRQEPWKTCNDICFTSPLECYRIKPEPRWFRNYYSCDFGISLCEDIDLKTEAECTRMHHFVRWLGERQYYDTTL